jgi:xanthine dehydrogenase accessory factor
LNAELAGDYGLTCGGTVTMLVEPVFVDDTLELVYAQALGAMARGERAIMVTGRSWSPEHPEKALVMERQVHGVLPPELRRSVRSFAQGREVPMLTRRGLIEAIAGAPRLVVFGCGHVGRAVGQAATVAGWRVTMVDDRPEYADASRLSFADRVVCCEFNDVAPAVQHGAGSYAVVATRGHQHDAVIVEQLVRLPLRYLGMLGSRRKAMLTKRLLERGGTPAELLDAVRSPVGLAIGADTPEEIAVSVVAEMIAVRRAVRTVPTTPTTIFSGRAGTSSPA